MAQFCRVSPSSSDARLGNRSSDDSLILDDGNTSGIWADNETEPATFQVTHSTGHISFSPNRSTEQSGEWQRGTWNGHLPGSSSADLRSLQNTFNVSMPARLSLSGEDSEVPLLSSVSYLWKYLSGI